MPTEAASGYEAVVCKSPHKKAPSTVRCTTKKGGPSLDVAWNGEEAVLGERSLQTTTDRRPVSRFAELKARCVSMDYTASFLSGSRGRHIHNLPLRSCLHELLHYHSLIW